VTVSVVICAYNAAHFLPDAFGTVAAQTMRDFELVLIDDGSTDATEAVAREHAHRFESFRYVRVPHGGLHNARNAGFRTAAGSLVAYLDADDLWSVDYLATMKGVFDERPATELVAADGFRVRTDGEVLGPMFQPGLPAVRGPLTAPRQWFDFFPGFGPSQMLFRRSLFERIGPFSVDLANGTEDWEWVIRALLAGADCVRVDRKLVAVRTQHGGNMSDNVVEMYDGWLSTIERLWVGSGNAEALRLAWQLTRPQIPWLLTRYSPAQNRAMLRRTKSLLGHERALTLLELLTYLGLCRALRLARSCKRQILPRRSSGSFVDLRAPHFEEQMA
jgi:glycosyltransferase involved in cell wall biosynthesis